MTTRNKKKNNKNKVKSFNPAKVYNNIPDKIKFKLPNISNSSMISSGSTVHSLHSSTVKNSKNSKK